MTLLPKSHTWPNDFAHPRKFDVGIENQSYTDSWLRYKTVLPESDDDDSLCGSDYNVQDMDDDSDQDDDEEAEGDEHKSQYGASETPATHTDQGQDLSSRIRSDQLLAVKVFMAGLEGEDENPMWDDMAKAVTSFFDPGGEDSGHNAEQEARCIAIVDDRTSSSIDSKQPQEMRHNFLTESQLRERLGRAVCSSTSSGYHLNHSLKPSC